MQVNAQIQNYTQTEKRIGMLMENLELRHFIIFSMVYKGKGVASMNKIMDVMAGHLPQTESQRLFIKYIISRDLNYIRSHTFKKIYDKKKKNYSMVIDSHGNPITGKYKGVFLVKDDKGNVCLLNSTSLKERFNDWMGLIASRCYERKNEASIALRMKTYKNLSLMIKARSVQVLQKK